MASRERRVSRPPLRFVEDEYLEQGKRKENRPTRQVYKLLKQKDVHADLEGQEVHVYWPEDQQWYRATVEEVTIQPETAAHLHYPDTDEYEDVNLHELIESKQIAVIENKSYYAKLKRDEIPVNAAERLTAVYEDESDPSASIDDDGSESEDLDDDVDDVDDPQAGRRQNKQVQRGKRPRDGGLERSGNAKRTASASSGGDEGAVRPHPHPHPHHHHHHLHHHSVPNGGAVHGTPASGRGGGAVHGTPASGRGGGGAAAAVAATTTAAGDALAADSDMAEAEAFKNTLMSALMHTFTGPASTMIPTPGVGGMIPTPGPPVQPPMIMIPTPGAAAGADAPGSARGPGSHTRAERGGGLRSQNSLPTAGSVGSDDEVRSKVREQLALALQRALDELKAEGYTEALPDPAAVSADVESEMYKLHENSVSKEYKAKFRSLAFNLKDNANPELRARVLRGELAPAKLVTLGPAELARKELSEWRQKRQEEAAKMVFLDAETAAKFSTAAAAALAQRRMKTKEEEAPAAKPTASPERAADAVANPAEPEHDGADGAAAAAASSAAAAAVLGGGGAATTTPSASSALPLQRRSSLGLPRTASGGEPAAAASAVPELPRRTSLQGSAAATGDAAGVSSAAAAPAAVAGLPVPPVTTLPVAPGGAATAALSPAKRAVLRAALPAAATTGEETPPRVDQDGDAPYDPDSYDEPYDPEAQHPDEDDVPKYDPVGAPSAAEEAVPAPTKSAAAPSIASLRGAPPPVALPAVVDRQGSLPSPIRSPPVSVPAAAAVPDLAPVIQRQQLGEGALADLPLDAVGQPLWTGVMRVPGAAIDNLVAVEVSYLGGSGRLAAMLLCSEPPTELLVKGQVKMSRVEQFFEELRRSRSRTITLALVRQLSPEAAAAAGLGEVVEAAARGGGMAEFVAQHRSRTGLATPQGSLEAYMVTRGPLAARLLKTARSVCPSHQLAVLPEDIGEEQLLMAMVHPRTWEPPSHVVAQMHGQGQHPPGQHPLQALHAPHGANHPLFGHQQTHPQPHPHALDAAAASVAPPPMPAIDFNDLAAVATGLMGPPVGAPPPAVDPRLRGAAPPEAPPAVIAPPQLHPQPAAAAPQADALPIDLGALSDLAAALGIPGGGGGGGPAAAPPPPLAPAPEAPPPQIVLEAAPAAGGGTSQLVTMLMQNPDGTLAIVAMPQGSAPPGGAPSQAAPTGGPPPPIILQPPPGPLGPSGPAGPGQPPEQLFQAPPPQQQPPPHAHPHTEHPGGPPPPQYLPPGAQPPPYGEPPPHEHYPGGHGQPPPGRYGGPPGVSAPPPYGDTRAGPPPPHGHHSYPPPQQHPHDPFYSGPPPPHYQPPPPPGHGGSDPGAPPPYGPSRDAAEGRPPPYYPPRDGPDSRGAGGYDESYYHRGGGGGGGPPGPHDGPYPYRGGPPGRGGGRGPPREWGGEHGRWGRGGRGGRGPHDEGRGGGGGGYGYDGYGDYQGGGGGGYRGGGRGGGRDRGEWGGGEGRREWEGGGRGDARERGRDRDRDHRGRGDYGRPQVQYPR